MPPDIVTASTTTRTVVTSTSLAAAFSRPAFPAASHRPPVVAIPVLN
eukprot:CAMPEP_0171730894 /NCGR_PEP_ID=MMETSP0991-20121206/28582_1 /TAXON_ID=483369 /ORGANISM="non described non described, Strain CCMP2098" /LENGTH=46 /DNA_ID= /DNA_START= /DNA_END= /DNA_ORIENTATION=